MKFPSQEVNFILTGRVYENQSKGIENWSENDTAATGRCSSCFVKKIISIEKEPHSPSLMLAYRIVQVFSVTGEDLCYLKGNKELEDKQFENL